ncbi:PREDICTED: zinc fingers and homeoboxes protein 2 [Thamnophis sirtalis]|uniref:Zinc fingers and homeoboxes protein 2 n=1 Tax=Thamnophis sirtalis TaxID=35019 RepID=A0A6I9YY49_9SAUR|nr:PREDICTED: zinc fingers and homeoboxes protein 2 [Thamnophis sirtalis]XP_013929603.1 PREDICTED: zinc fingers and homeoboxes protein 2 [Thamnophis sirtalis]
MASKRKSTTPCMVRASEAPESGDPMDCSVGKAPGAPEQDLENNLAASKDVFENDCEVIEGKSSPANPTRKTLGGYECKYCPFSSQNLNEFTEHIDTQHPNVILNPLYVCSECNFTTKKYDSLSEHNAKLHPGENNFKLKLIKLNNQTVLEQSIEVTGGPAVVETVDYEGAGDTNKGAQIINPGKPKSEAKKASVDNHLDGVPQLPPDITESITCINGAEVLQDILAHVMPSVQLPPNINLVPKVPVPLNSTKYNSALDTNSTMISSFNKFPYPTQAELSWLTAASKHPEEQIRIWFATQRLKHGISWSPEEVEEARKKMFNGTIQPTHQTIAVLPAHVATAKMPQPLIQTAVPCQILSQTGLVLTQVSNGSNVSPITLTVAANQGQKRGGQNQLAVPEAKRQHVNPTEALAKQNVSAAPVSTTTVPHSTVLATSPSDRKKTKEQIASLKASFIVTQFPDDAEVYRLIEVTGLSRTEIKKWFSDYRYRTQRGISHITSDSVAKDQLALSSARQDHTYHPYPDFIFQQFKGKTQKQIAILEESFLKNAFPTHIELERLRTDARMTRKEVECWFAERRKLRDNMEQAVLDSMGSSVKNKDAVASNGATNPTEQVSISQPPTSSLKSSTAFAPSSQEQVRLLKSTFVRTQWPSPQEYDELAAQTGLTRTEIVRWFKENRSSLRMGTLKWLDQYQQQSVTDECVETKGPKPPGTKNNHEDVQLPNKGSQKVGKLSAESPEPSDVQISQNSQRSIDDDAASDCIESWNESGPKSKTDFDSESIAGDNAHT